MQKALVAFAAYARQFYDALERNAIISSFYLGMSLTGLESKSFGRRPTSSVNQMTVPIHRIEDPLKVPKEPSSESHGSTSATPQV